jgi:hypothetical protein
MSSILKCLIILVALSTVSSIDTYGQFDEYLYAYWSFEDSTANDHSGNGYHGTIMNNVWPVIGVNGRGTALHLEGYGENTDQGGTYYCQEYLLKLLENSQYRCGFTKKI